MPVRFEDQKGTGLLAAVSFETGCPNEFLGVRMFISKRARRMQTILEEGGVYVIRAVEIPFSKWTRLRYKYKQGLYVEGRRIPQFGVVPFRELKSKHRLTEPEIGRAPCRK